VRPEVCDLLVFQRGLDQRGVGARSDRAEGDGLGPHTTCRHERVEATTHVHSLVDGPYVTSWPRKGVAAHREVHEDLPHEDDPSHPGIGVRGRDRLLGGSALARILSLGGLGSTRGRLARRTQCQQFEGDGWQVEVGGEFYLGEHGGIEGLDPEHTA
jgi:hypothetical protein